MKVRLKKEKIIYVNNSPCIVVPEGSEGTIIRETTKFGLPAFFVTFPETTLILREREFEKCL